jgi:hypothetical protein
MTKKLEEFFNLPESGLEQPAGAEADIEQKKELITSAENIIDRIDRALPEVRELDGADDELDELAKLARDKFEDLMDLGMNVEARYSGQILQTAGILLGHALTAKQAKIDKKLRMVDLQLKKMRLDQVSAKEGNGPTPLEGQAVVLDRNELLKQILSERNDSKKLQ